MMNGFQTEACLSIAFFLPLLGALSILFISQFFSSKTIGILGSAAVFGSFIAFAALGLLGYDRASVQPYIICQWLPDIFTHTTANLAADFALYLDELSLLMCLIITGVGFLIHAYSIGYMEHETSVRRYFLCMNFFIFSMLLLVLASNLLLLFLGWEGVGLASYLLIGYWFERPKAAAAAKKAFIMNRIGDVGLLLGIILSFYTFHTSDIESIVRNASTAAPYTLSILALLYFIGAAGKSAQMPLHTWLPDAMEGPTPVSALIHAATMVTAGVYLVVRLSPLFIVAPKALEAIAYIGAITALFAALCATSQYDIKRVLAYSTLSQLGLMFLACGCGAGSFAMFHLTMHAFVKALLFLAAGSVIHMLHGETDMRKMGGLAPYLPKTSLMFLIGAIAMAGIPPFALFFSKDLILEAAASENRLLYGTGLFISGLTAFYMTRAYVLTFLGSPATERGGVSEAPAIMNVPAAALAALSCIGGFIGVVCWPQKLAFHTTAVTWISCGIALLGAMLAVMLYRRSSPSVRLFQHGFYLDHIYSLFFIQPCRALSQLILGHLEPYLFQGSIGWISHISYSTASVAQRMQSGQLRSYVAWMVAGALFFFGSFLVLG